jgi:hypothetical protein
VLIKLQLAAGRCRHQITELDQTRIVFKKRLVMKNNKRHFFSYVSEEITFLKFQYAVSQSFLSFFPYLSEETMATAKSAAIYWVKC